MIMTILSGAMLFGSAVVRENGFAAFSDNQGALEADSCVVKEWGADRSLDSICFFPVLDSVARGAVDGYLTESLCPQLEVSSEGKLMFQLLSDDLFVDARHGRKVMFGIGSGKLIRNALRNCLISGEVRQIIVVDSQKNVGALGGQLILPEDKCLAPRIKSSPSHPLSGGKK